MPKKYAFQLLQDLVLTAVLLTLLGYHQFGESWHEWAGVAFIALIFSHTGLNFWWFKRLFQGEFDGFRLLKTAVNMLLIVDFLAAGVSGILLSKHLFAEMPFHLTDDFTRKTHMLSVHYLQILVGVHLGINWKMLGNFLAKHAKIAANNRFFYRILPIIWLSISVYGFWSFVDRDQHLYLINTVDFAFFDPSESALKFYADYFAMLIGVAYLVRILVWLNFFKT